MRDPEITHPVGGWTLPEFAWSVSLLDGPCPGLDRLIDLFLRGGLRVANMVDAAFAGWAVPAPPRYTGDPEAVRSVARAYGIVVTSVPLPHGHEATARDLEGRVARECGPTQALSELMTLLVVLAGR